jgi:gliding motility-associated protein GldL
MKPGSKAWKNFMAKLYGIGAAVVIIGALFKIQHWPFANAMLIVGLGTEAFIFFFSAFEPPHEDPDWSLVYPELAHGDGGDDEDDEEELEALVLDDSRPVSEQLDDMLEQAKIGPELIKSLGDGMRALGDQATKLAQSTDAAVVTTEYVDVIKNATIKVGSLSDSYETASHALLGIANPEDGVSAGENLKKMSENLKSLNDMYELQLQGSADSLKEANRLFSGVGELVQNLSESVSDTREYRDNISELSKNLSSLNKVYGNMLNAMSFNPSND